MQRSKTSSKKRSKFRKFLDNLCKTGDDYFGSIRLILPSLDRERGSYGLKESVLANCLIDAIGLSKDSEDAKKLINWRKGGSKTGFNVGNFGLVAAEVLQRRQGTISGGLTIKELNNMLDRLASSENRGEKTAVLADLIQKTNAQEMKWIVKIILKDLKLGVSEKSIFQEFHPDAEDLLKVTCDLKLVSEKLKDRSQRHKHQDIEIGKAVRIQLALRISDATSAWKKLHGKEVVVECKFDGDRIQIHKNGPKINFYSRNFLDHPEYEHAMSNIIMQNILVDRCILDGEILVWDTFTNRFAEFGSNQETAKAAREGFSSDRQYRMVVNVHRSSGEPCWSIIAHNVEMVDKFFEATIENRDEGIVLKDLGSKWEPNDRSGKWLKLKPDYIHTGGYYGSGRRGGEVAQFLVGLAEPSASNTYPRRFISFCRVGTGLSDDGLMRICCTYSLRFPRIDRVRYDKPWHECLDLQSFVDLVNSSNGNTRGADYGGSQYNKPKRAKPSSKGDKKNVSVVPSHFLRTDVSGVTEETLVFENMMFYFINVPPTHSLDLFRKMVVENGGAFSMNLNDSVTHCIAAKRKGIKFEAAMRRGDVIHYSWVLDCCLQKRLLHLQPKYFLFLGDSSKEKLQEEVDEFADSYYWDLDLADIRQLFNNINPSEDLKSIGYYKKTYCPKTKWSRFQGCCLYFYSLTNSINSDWDFLLETSVKRLRLEVTMGGGEVSEKLSYATHVVVLSVPGYDVEFDSILESFSAAEKHCICSKKLYVVGYEWLEDSLEMDQKLDEEKYNLKPYGLEESNIEMSEHEISATSRKDGKSISEETAVQNVRISAASEVVGNRKRGRPTLGNTKRGRTVASQARQTRVKGRQRPAKLDESEPEKSASSDDTSSKEAIETGVSQARRTRAKMGAKHAKIDENELGISAGLENGPYNEATEPDSGFHEIHETETKEDDENNMKQKADFLMYHKETISSKGEEKMDVSEKSEVTLDPLQVMLLNMIPSLGVKPEAYQSASGSEIGMRIDPSIGVKKTEASKPALEGEVPLRVDPDAGPPKKKKVSYKDVAGELLKDW
ncbi:hypothetical protein MKX01_010700 [Papaver californicum]|nr:hypothetical protein MKX01_010700 [Papaver californicum]